MPYSQIHTSIQLRTNNDETQRAPKGRSATNVLLAYSIFTCDKEILENIPSDENHFGCKVVEGNEDRSGLK